MAPLLLKDMETRGTWCASLVQLACLPCLLAASTRGWMYAAYQGTRGGQGKWYLYD